MGILLVVGIAGGIFLWSQSEPRPEGTSGPEAEALVDQMFEYINKPAWDTTHYISWSFPGGHDYVWNKKEHQVEVKWSDKRVLLHTKTVSGVTFDGPTASAGNDQALIDKAWGFFCNDSWWLNPMVKAKDPGTTREKVTLDDGRSGVLVSYSSGGVTPGDAYLFLLDENGKPTAYQMWVQIIPVGGMEFGFEEWTTLSSGAKLVDTYSSGVNLNITNLKSGQTLASIGHDEGLFDEL